MATEIREFSRDEISSVIPSFGQPAVQPGVTSDIQGVPLGAAPAATPKKPPARNLTNAPVNTMQLPPVVGASLNAPGTDNVAMPDVQAVTDAVNQANQNIQTNLPAPKPGSASQVLGNEVKQVGSSLADTLMNNWQIPVGLATAYGIYKLLGEGGGGPPDNPPPPPKKSMRDRMLLGEVKEPTLDLFSMSPAGQPAPTTEAPPKPMLSERDMEMIRQSEANKAAKEAEAAAKAAAAKIPMAPKQEFVGPLQNDFMGPRLPPFVGPPESDIQGPPKPMAPPEAPKVEAPPVSGTSAETEKPAGKKRGPKTAEQKAAEATALEQKIASMEDRLPSAPNPKKSNKLLPTDVIGQGGWHWYQGQMGPAAEENWLRAFGRTNQSYADVKQAMKEGRLPGPVVPEGKKGGAFPREATVPGYVKGAISPGAIGLTGALAAAAGLLTPGQSDAKTIARNVGEALLPMGLTPSELASGTLPPEKVAALEAFMRERQKLGSPYRGIAPPR